MSLTAAVYVLLKLLIAGLIFWLFYWALNRIDPPQPWRKVAEVVLVVVGVLVCIGILLSIVPGAPTLFW